MNVTQGAVLSHARYLPVLVTEVTTSAYKGTLKWDTTSQRANDGTPTRTLKSQVYLVLPRRGLDQRTMVTERARPRNV